MTGQLARGQKKSALCVAGMGGAQGGQEIAGEWCSGACTVPALLRTIGQTLSHCQASLLPSLCLLQCHRSLCCLLPSKWAPVNQSEGLFQPLISLGLLQISLADISSLSPFGSLYYLVKVLFVSPSLHPKKCVKFRVFKLEFFLITFSTKPSSKGGFSS